MWWIFAFSPLPLTSFFWANPIGMARTKASKIRILRFITIILLKLTGNDADNTKAKSIAKDNPDSDKVIQKKNIMKHEEYISDINIFALLPYGIPTLSFILLS